MNVRNNNSEKCTRALFALADVIDPEIGLNVVDLGLIYRIDFLEEEKKIEVDMTLTTQFCPMGESITNNVSRAIAQKFQEYAVNLNLVFEPPWDPEMITTEGKKFLGNN
ncbi:MAG: metal-sulfur cluster assembly factor [Cyclobacteriaceae bacterium]|nr:metal-sulfur cluster assembly factor [Cyclobacteriaceae bacterium]